MASRPNILVILTDDHGQWASSPYGNSEILSPSLDYLAARGARFTHAFTPSPVCSPARASFWTGKLPSAHGIHDYIRDVMKPGTGSVVHPGIRGQTTLAQRLHDAGYSTALSGKWHCHHFELPPPGFDTWFTLGAGTNARFGPQPFIEGATRIDLFGHQAPHITDHAIGFLRQRPPEKPFFLFVGYTNTHDPHIQEPARLVNRYRNATFRDIPNEPFDSVHGVPRITLPTDETARRAQHAQYYAAVSMIDEQTGRILDELDARGELENTLIVYTSDHGHMNGHHGLHTKGNATIPQNFLDESILVPCLVSWPGHIPAGQIRPEFVDHCDLHATLLDAAGAPALTPADLSPGHTYLPLLTGEPTAWRDAQFCEYGNARMIRTAAAKLILRYPGPNGYFPDEFYDLALDPRESVNRIADPACAAQIAALTSRLNAYFVRYESPARSGRHIADQPTCNDWQPWTTPAVPRQPQK